MRRTMAEMVCFIFLFIIIYNFKLWISNYIQQLVFLTTEFYWTLQKKVVGWRIFISSSFSMINEEMRYKNGKKSYFSRQTAPRPRAKPRRRTGSGRSRVFVGWRTTIRSRWCGAMSAFCTFLFHLIFLSSAFPRATNVREKTCRNEISG